jgi:hypothetical protein
VTDRYGEFLCEVYGIVSCPCGQGPIEVACTETGDHRCHNFVIPEDVVEAVKEMRHETKEEMIERLKRG